MDMPTLTRACHRGSVCCIEELLFLRGLARHPQGLFHFRGGFTKHHWQASHFEGVVLQNAPRSLFGDVCKTAQEFSF